MSPAKHCKHPKASNKSLNLAIKSGTVDYVIQCLLLLVIHECFVIIVIVMKYADYSSFIPA